MLAKTAGPYVPEKQSELKNLPLLNDWTHKHQVLYCSICKDEANTVVECFKDVCNGQAFFWLEGRKPLAIGGGSGWCPQCPTCVVAYQDAARYKGMKPVILHLR